MGQRAGSGARTRAFSEVYVWGVLFGNSVLQTLKLAAGWAASRLAESEGGGALTEGTLGLAERGRVLGDVCRCNSRGCGGVGPGCARGPFKHGGKHRKHFRSRALATREAANPGSMRRLGLQSALDYGHADRDGRGS